MTNGECKTPHYKQTEAVQDDLLGLGESINLYEGEELIVKETEERNRVLEQYFDSLGIEYAVEETEDGFTYLYQEMKAGVADASPQDVAEFINLALENSEDLQNLSDDHVYVLGGINALSGVTELHKGVPQPDEEEGEGTEEEEEVTSGNYGALKESIPCDVEISDVGKSVKVVKYL